MRVVDVLTEIEGHAIVVRRIIEKPQTETREES